MNRDKFKELQDRWYRKLKRTGFVDIELTKDSDNRMGPAKQGSVYSEKRMLLDQDYSRTAGEGVGETILFNYYRLCRIFLAHGKFRSKIHKTVFKLYADGKPYLEIARHLDKMRRPHLPRSTWYVASIMSDNKEDLLTFHRTHKEGEYRTAPGIPGILDPNFSPHLKNRRGKPKY